MPTSRADEHGPGRQNGPVGHIGGDAGDTRGSRALLEVNGLASGYGNAPVIRDVDLVVCAGEAVAVIGPNGAGKSTLLKTILGFLTPMAGRILLAGQPIGGQSTERIARRGVGYVPQVNDIFDTLTVLDNLEMGGYRLPRRELGRRVAEVTELYPALRPMLSREAGKLSGGERKMLGMARVLMTRPSLLVLDEPTAGLSPQLSTELLAGHVSRLAETGVSVLLVEQHAREALAVSGWAYLMVSGLVQMAGPASALLERPDVGEMFLGRLAQRPQNGSPPLAITTREESHG